MSATLGRKDGFLPAAFVDENGQTYGIKQTNNAPHVTIDNQDTLLTLIETLQELSQRLAPLAGAMSSGAPALRTSGVGTFAVSGPATSAQVVTALLTHTNTLWINNTMAVQSNINNCIGK